MSTPNDKEVRQARINEAVAEDVAVGMAAKAERAENVAVGMAAAADIEATRADALAAQNARQAAHLSDVRAERDMAAAGGAIAREDASKSSFAFWLLLGIVAVGLALWAFWYATRPEPTTSSVTIQQTPATAPPAAAVTTRPAQPAPAPPPAAAPPVVVQQPVAVPVPVPVERPAPAEASAPAERPAPAEPPMVKPDQTIIVQPGGAAPAESGAGESGSAGSPGG